MTLGYAIIFFLLVSLALVLRKQYPTSAESCA